MSSLFPPGINHLADLPWPFFDAIRQAFSIISWHEDLPEDERPPKRLWLDAEGLSLWFARVRRERERKYGLKPGDSDGGPSVDSGLVDDLVI